MYILDMLLTEPIQKDGTQLPSPEQLKRKIILKVEFYFVMCGVG